MEYEGSEKFLENNLSKIFHALFENFKKLDNNISFDNRTLPDENVDARNNEKEKNLSITTIATHLGISKGKDLVLAACAYLQLVRHKREIQRSEILDLMKEASGFYNKNTSKNLSRNIQQLIKERSLNELKSDTYSLTETKKLSIKERLDEL